MSSASSLNSLLSSASPASSSSSLDISSLLAAATGATSVGIDVTSAVDAAIYAEQAPERIWEAQQSTLQSQISAVTSIQTALSQVTSDLQALNNPQGALAATTVSTSNSSVVTASSTSGAVAGNHVVTVGNLATTASWYSAPVANASASLGSSVFTITQTSGAQTSFNLANSSASSLTQLAASINTAGIGVDASVISDTTGSRLALVSQSTGAASNFTVSDTASAASTFSSASLASGLSPLPASSFQIGDGSNSATITVASGATLSSVADQINQQGLNLSASVVTDSSGAHLAIMGNGASSVSMSEDPVLVLKQPSQGTDASLTVDGIPITSASNSVSNAIPGVTLNLQGTTTGTQVADLQVTADTNQISTAISQFVTDYNSAATLVNSQFNFSSTTSSQGVLGSDASVRSLQSALLAFGSYVVPSSAKTQASDSASPVNTLADLGITMNNDGTLTLNSSQLDQAISSNPTGVQNFFQGTALNGFAGTSQSDLAVFDDPGSGVLQSDVQNMNSENTDLQTNVNNYESGYIASQRTILTTMYSNAEVALQQLPTQLKQLQAQLGSNSSGG